MYFESHAHYDDKRYNMDRKELLLSLKEEGIDYIVNIGSDMKSTKRSVALANEYPFVYASVGVHPHDTDQMTENDLKLLEEFTKNEKVVSIGEIGLDFFCDFSTRDNQRYWFQRQLELVKRLNMPVVIHSRDADMEVFQTIEDSGVRKGVIHCYSGSKELALEYVKLGYYIGVGGVVTFKNGRKLVETVRDTPLERILIETDAPYLSPEPFRGERNSSKNLKLIVDKISEIKQIPPEKVCEQTMKNAKEMYAIK